MTPPKTKFVPANDLLNFKTYGDEFRKKRHQAHVENQKTRLEDLIRNPQVECERCHRKYYVLPDTDLHTKVAAFTRKVRGKKVYVIGPEACHRCSWSEELMLMCGYDALHDNISDDEDIEEPTGHPIAIAFALEDTKQKWRGIMDPNNDDPDPLKTVGKALDSLTRELVRSDEIRITRGEQVRMMLGEEVK